MEIITVDFMRSARQTEQELIAFARNSIQRVIERCPDCVLCFDTKKAPLSEEQMRSTAQYLFPEKKEVQICRLWVDGYEPIILKLSGGAINLLPFFIKSVNRQMVEAIPFAIEQRGAA